MPSPNSIIHSIEPRTWAFRPSLLVMMGAGAPPRRDAERGDGPRVPPSLKDNMATTILRHNLDLNSDSITYCSWAGMPPASSKYTPDGSGDQAVGARVFSAVTGINMNHDEMMEAMNPVANIERCIHVREGRRKEDDLYNDATYESPGWAHTSKEAFIEAMEEYYKLRGWDPATGIPRRSTLEKQGLKKIADELENKYGVELPE
jgi:aldehyde:ferredoxin oxidoreductase